MPPSGNSIWQHLAGKAEGDGAGDVRLERTIAEEPWGGVLGFDLKQPIGGCELAMDPIEPRLMLLFRRPKIVLIHDLHRLLARGERKTDNSLGAGMDLYIGRYEA